MPCVKPYGSTHLTFTWHVVVLVAQDVDVTPFLVEDAELAKPSQPGNLLNSICQLPCAAVSYTCACMTPRQTTSRIINLTAACSAR